MSTETKTLNAVRLPCLCCGESEAGIRVNLWTLDDPSGGNFTCGECDATFSRNDILNLVEKWQNLIKWVDQLPAL